MSTSTPTSTPTNSSTPTIPSPNLSLSQRINLSTRPQHTHLNTLLLSLLPLALPPHTLNPTLYAYGISQILPIYEAFEGALESLWLGTKEKDENRYQHWEGNSGRGADGGEGEGEGDVEERNEDQDRSQKQDEAAHGKANLLAALRLLHIPHLLRSSRLRQDISSLLPKSGTPNPLPQNNPTAPNTSPNLAAFLAHINTTLSPSASPASKPHLLLAYTWILYMALFSGGRHIHSQLRLAGPSFWNPSSSFSHQNPPRHNPTHQPPIDIDSHLTFFTFPITTTTTSDGSNLKAQLTTHFRAASSHLTDPESEEVIREGIYIMESITAIIAEIASTVTMNQTQERKDFTQAQPQIEPEIPPQPQPLLVDSTQQQIQRESNKKTLSNEKEKKAAAIVTNGTGIGFPEAKVEEVDSSMRWLLLKHILPMGLAELMMGAVGAVMVGNGDGDGKLV